MGPNEEQCSEQYPSLEMVSTPKKKGLKAKIVRKTRSSMAGIVILGEILHPRPVNVNLFVYLHIFHPQDRVCIIFLGNCIVVSQGHMEGT